MMTDDSDVVIGHASRSAGRFENVLWWAFCTIWNGLDISYHNLTGSVDFILFLKSGK